MIILHDFQVFLQLCIILLLIFFDTEALPFEKWFLPFVTFLPVQIWIRAFTFGNKRVIRSVERGSRNTAIILYSWSALAFIIAILYVAETITFWERPTKTLDEVIDEVIMSIYLLLGLNQFFLVYLFCRVSEEYRWRKNEIETSE